MMPLASELRNSSGSSTLLGIYIFYTEAIDKNVNFTKGFFPSFFVTFYISGDSISKLELTTYIEQLEPCCQDYRRGTVKTFTNKESF